MAGAEIDTSMLKTPDIADLALQRTSTLLRLPVLGRLSPSFEAWRRLGTDVVLRGEAKLRRREIVHQWLSEVSADTARITKQLSLPDGARVMDVGCGLGLVDVFLCRQYQVDQLLLVDIERTAEKHHAFHKAGAGYTSLQTTHSFVLANIPTGTTIQTLNPQKTDLLAQGGGFDLIFSLLSCGFHYPVDTYMDAFRAMLATDGKVLIDLRIGQDHAAMASEFRLLETVEITDKYTRGIWMRRR